MCIVGYLIHFFWEGIVILNLLCKEGGGHMTPMGCTYTLRSQKSVLIFTEVWFFSMFKRLTMSLTICSVSHIYFSPLYVSNLEQWLINLFNIFLFLKINYTCTLYINVQICKKILFV